MLNNKLKLIGIAAAIAVVLGVGGGLLSTKDDMEIAKYSTTAVSSESIRTTGETFTVTEEEEEPDSTQEETESKTSFWDRYKKDKDEDEDNNEDEDEDKASEKDSAKTEKKTSTTEKTKRGKKDKASTTQVKTTKTPSTKKSSKLVEDYEYADVGFTPAYADIDDDNWELLLVNRHYILPDNYEPKRAPSITGDSSSCELDYRVAPHYNEMYQAAKKDGIYLTPVSGYRSITRQRNNFENKIDYYIDLGYSKAEATDRAARRILPPGTSEHNAGFAMDIITADSGAHFEQTKEYKWLEENAADYGFILRYPEDKVDVTEIIYEPWHWRYVGVKAAKAMKASGQCLEEYLGVA